MASFRIQPLLLLLLLTIVIIYSALRVKGAFISIIILTRVIPTPPHTCTPKTMYQLGSQQESRGTFTSLIENHLERGLFTEIYQSESNQENRNYANYFNKR